MKIFGYILIFAFLTMSVPVSADSCSEESSMQCASMANESSDSNKVAGADYCLCVFHHMQFGAAKEVAYLELKFLSIKFTLPQDTILASLEANILLQPPSLV